MQKVSEFIPFFLGGYVIFKVIRLLLSLALLFGMLYLGKLIAYFIPIGISDSIWGMLLLFACLVIGIVKVEWVTPSARPLTRYMTVFFIPVCAEIIEHVDVLYSHVVSFLLANVLSSTLSLMLIGLFAQKMFHRYK